MTITTNPKYIAPAYSNSMIYEFTDTSVDYFIVTLLFNGTETREFKVPAINNVGEFDISTICQQFLNSDITPLTTDYVVEPLNYYTTTVKAYYNNSNTSTVVDVQRFFINATEQYNENFNYLEYMSIADEWKFLNVYDYQANTITARDTDYLEFTTLNGIYQGNQAQIGSGYVTDNNDVLIYTYTLSNLTNGIKRINISPSYIKANAGANVTIFNAATHLKFVFTTDSDSGLGSYVEQVRFSIKLNRVNSRFREFRLGFINNLGALDFVNFNLNHQEKFNVGSINYENNNIIKVINITAENTFDIFTDNLTDIENSVIRYLWYSPSIVDFNEVNTPKVILDVNTVNIIKKNPLSIPRYGVTMRYERNFKTQLR